MNSPIAHAIQTIDSGRLFVRNLPDNTGAFVGVIDVPCSVPVEHLVAARMGQRLWLDTSCPEPMTRRFEWKEFVPETDVTGLLRSLKFRASSLPDAFELGVRASEMRHDESSRRWAIAFGAIKDIRGWPLAMQTDGLFELDANGPRLVSRDPQAGKSIGMVLREPLWGPAGRFGLAHSLDPLAYPAFIKASRAETMRKDDQFAQFLELTRDRPEHPLVYTREQQQTMEKDMLELVQASHIRVQLKKLNGLAGSLGIEQFRPARAARKSIGL